LGLVGSSVSLLLLFHFLPIEQVREQIRSVSLQRWVLVMIGYLCTHLVVATKWQLVVNAAGAELGWRQAVRCCFAGLFGNLFLPSLVGGDMVRAMVGLRASSSRTGVLFGSGLDRLLDVVATAIVVSIGALMVPIALDDSTRDMFRVVTATLGLVGLGILTMVWTLPAWTVPRAIRRKCDAVLQVRHLVVQRSRRIFIALVLGLASQFGFILLMAFLSAACGLSVDVRVWVFAFPLAKLLALTPATIAGIGVREAGLAVLLTPFGVTSAAAVSVGLMWETIVISGGLLAGALALATNYSIPAAVAVRSACSHSMSTTEPL
jgi:uncharacterized membrane protein YbhN (UPF0104 family)